jgi:soluble lytic murein transglycosylase-like protein
MRARYFSLIVFCAILQVGVCSAQSPAAPTAPIVASVAAVSDSDAARCLIVLRKSVHGAFRNFVGARLSASAVSLSDLGGSTIEVSGRITGIADLGGEKMLLIDSKIGLINASVSKDIDGGWLKSGAQIRALLYVPDPNTLSRLNQVVPLIASAPEFAVFSADVAEAKANQKADLEKQKQAELLAKKQAEQYRAQEERLKRSSIASRSGRYNLRSDQMPDQGAPICALSDNALRVYRPYRAFVQRANSRLSDRMIDTITSSILYFSEKERIDPRLIISMILAESNFDPNSTSRVGAMGLGQLMPGTASGLGVSNAYDPIQNIAAAAHILSVRVKQYGGAREDLIVPDRVLALTMASYNAGPGAVKKYGGVPPYGETQRYVRKVQRYYHQICGA